MARPQLPAKIGCNGQIKAFFAFFFAGRLEKCELTTNYVIMVSKNMKTNASFYRAKL